jgi:hypothetical protein
MGASSYTLEAVIAPSAAMTGSAHPEGIMGWGNYATNNQCNALRLSGVSEEEDVYILRITPVLSLLKEYRNGVKRTEEADPSTL